MAWIAIDAGTSVIKAVAFAEDGGEIASARRPTAVLHPQPGYSEQDMQGVWSAVAETIQELLPQIQEEVCGLVSTAQGDGVWLVDANAQPTGNAILWNDGRATAQVEAWRKAGVVEQSFRSSGCVTYPGLPNAIFAWLAEHEPERIARARWALTCNGWIHARLTGRLVADLSDASNPFSDVVGGEYAPQVIRAYGVEQYAHLLPPIVKLDATVAPLSIAVAKQFGLPAGLPVVMAPYDIVSTAYGCGAASAGQACVILGTTICTETLTQSLDLSVSPSGTTIALHDGLHLRAMPTLTGCEALDWAAALLQVETLDVLGELAAQAVPGSGGIFFLPYLSAAGERSPFLDPVARGSFHGVSLFTTRAEMARAVYEGLSFVIHECLRTAAPDALREVYVCGGGARSDLWCQMIADVIGIPVVRSADREVGARGAHLFALLATGSSASIADGVKRFVRGAARFEPSTEVHSFYANRFAAFLGLRDLARQQWHFLAEVR